MVLTIQQFSSLESTFIGGTKGRVLTENALQIFQEFQTISREVTQVDYEIMDIKMKKFDEMFQVFREKIAELEKRSVNLIIQAIDTQDNLVEKFKILEFFEILIQRPFISDEMEKKIDELISLFEKELEEIKLSFTKVTNKERDFEMLIFVSENYPPIIKRIKYIQGLLARISVQLECFKDTDFFIMEREEFQGVLKSYEKIYQLMEGQIQQEILEWRKEVESLTEQSL